MDQLVWYKVADPSALLEQGQLQEHVNEVRREPYEAVAKEVGSGVGQLKESLLAV